MKLLFGDIISNYRINISPCSKSSFKSITFHTKDTEIIYYIVHGKRIDNLLLLLCLTVNCMVFMEMY
jgi:hypothetical protein